MLQTRSSQESNSAQVSFFYDSPIVDFEPISNSLFHVKKILNQESREDNSKSAVHTNNLQAWLLKYALLKTALSPIWKFQLVQNLTTRMGSGRTQRGQYALCLKYCTGYQFLSWQNKKCWSLLVEGKLAIWECFVPFVFNFYSTVLRISFFLF